MSLYSLASAKRQLFRLVASSALLLGAASCSSDKKETPANLVSRNDFESFDGWGPTTTSLSNAKAHSGSFSVKVDPEIEYSVGYRNTFVRASSTKISKLHVSGWVLMTGPKAKAVIVVQVNDPATGAQVYWQAADVKAEVKTLNHWTQIDKDFELPATITPAQELRVYMWRTSPDDTTYLDDLEITKG